MTTIYAAAGLTNFVIEGLDILKLPIVGAAKHGHHTCMTRASSVLTGQQVSIITLCRLELGYP